MDFLHVKNIEQHDNGQTGIPRWSFSRPIKEWSLSQET